MSLSFIPHLPLRPPPAAAGCVPEVSPRHSPALCAPLPSLTPPTPAVPVPAHSQTLNSASRRDPQGYEDVLDCVLKVFCTHCEPNYELPWAMTAQRHSTSSAFIISGHRILTNAHSVEHYTNVLVKKRYDDTKYAARVVAIGNECDIALLEIDDHDFWDEFDSHQDRGDGAVPYLEPGMLPELQDPVRVIGYPSPGNQISVTAGVSSRVEMLHYVHGQGELLAVQIDAAINPGNSGGPVINKDHKVVGIAFQSVDPSQADSVGYFIPYSVVDHFLTDIEKNRRYTSFPFCGFRWQRLENAHLRRALGMSEKQSGILVKWVAETCDAARVLRKGDIVTHIDGTSISNAGTVPFRFGERIGLDYMVTRKFTNDVLQVRFFRGGVAHDDGFRLSGMGEHRLVQVHDARHRVRRQPEYLICGGLVFQVLSEPFLRTCYGSNWILEAPVRLIDQYYRGMRTKTGRRELVVLSQILATSTTTGYEEENVSDVVIVKRMNNEDVNSLRHLAELIDGCRAGEEFWRFELENDEVLIIDRKTAEREEEETLKTHCIPAARSIGADRNSTGRDDDGE